MEVLLIEEIDLSDGERLPIGVVDSSENAELLIKTHYGQGLYEETVRWDTRHMNGEFALTLRIFKDEATDEHKVKIVTTWFTLNELN